MGQFYYTDLGKAMFKARLISNSVSINWKTWSNTTNSFGTDIRTSVASPSTAHVPFCFSYTSGNYAFATANNFNANITLPDDSTEILGMTTITTSVSSNKERIVSFTIENTSSATINVKTIYCCATSVRYNTSSGNSGATWGYELDNVLEIPAGQSKTVTITLVID